MRTVKLVVVGPSGVGKTSLRNQYISGRFTTGYRATIGADFITKTVPHHNDVAEKVTLQIWDTAGQERFSSLSSAFFRGADAVLLMFDVNQPQTLEALKKWWNEFKDRAPLPEEEVDRFCCVFVGNKIDVQSNVARDQPRVEEADALRLMTQLIPSSSVANPVSSQLTLASEESEITLSVLTPSPPQTHSIDIGVYHHHLRRKSSRSRSRSTLFRGGTVGTMTTTHTISVYHTPTSSIFDSFESARSSPVPSSPRHTVHSRLSSPRTSRSRSRSTSPVRLIRRQPSFSSTLSDAQTITPSLFGRTQQHAMHEPPPPELGAKLFFTSAKTGDGVTDVFEYIAKRVVTRWEYEEAMEARTLHVAEASSDTIRLRHPNDSGFWKSTSCCGA